MAVHNINGQSIGIWPEYKNSDTFKLWWRVTDYRQPQLSTHGALSTSYDNLYKFAEQVVQRMGTANIGKTVAIKEACKYVKG